MSFQRPPRAVAEVAAAAHVVEAGLPAGDIVVLMRVRVRVLLAAHRVTRLASAARVRLQQRAGLTFTFE